MTPDQEQRVAYLRSLLPPIRRNGWPDPTQIKHDRTRMVCIDLEWHTDKCTCGHPERPDGLLELIGVGNDQYVSHFWWQELEQDDQRLVRDTLMALCRRVPVLFHNAVGDLKKLRENGFAFLGPWNFAKLNDSMLLHSLLESEKPHDLEYLSAEHGKLPPHKDLQYVAGAEDVYNAGDIVQTYLIWTTYLAPFMERDPQTEFIYRTLSMPDIWQIIEGEEAGIRVNPHTPVPLFQKYDQKRQQATRLAQAAAGWPINIGSPDQLKHQLYNIEGLPVQRKKTARWEEEGKATTDKDAIATLRRRDGTEWDPDVPPTLEQAMENIEAGANPVLEARDLFYGAQQAISHYIKPCFEGEVGTSALRPRVYPECHQHVQASGRDSYVKPALSQIKGELLEQYTPDIGHCWVGHDWKQIEVRLLAVLANDIPYLEAFARGDDVHGFNARAVFGVAGSPELEDLRRRFIKAFAFRLHYRGQPENAGDIPGTRALGLDVPRLVESSQRYLGAHPSLPPYWEAIEREADRTGMVRTFMGRARRLTAQYLAARNREACNHPMQGGVADIYKQTKRLVKEAAVKAGIPCRFVFGAFDSQFWQVPNECRLDFAMLYRPIVQRPFTINSRSIIFPADFKVWEAA